MLLHFTGSGHFNRSMRHKADKMVGVVNVISSYYILLKVIA